MPAENVSACNNKSNQAQIHKCVLAQGDFQSEPETNEQKYGSPWVSMMDVVELRIIYNDAACPNTDFTKDKYVCIWQEIKNRKKNSFLGSGAHVRSSECQYLTKT